MRAALITAQGTPVAENVRLDLAHADPIAGPGEVVVRTEAAALNHLDLWVGRGVPGLELTYPRISGSDGCGVVEAAGAGVDPAWIGRRVVLNGAVPLTAPPGPAAADGPPQIRMIGEHDPGCMAERFVAPATNVADVGDDADPVAAAAFGLTHLTAWRMLVTRAGLVEGDPVLITGIGGGVALAALNICRHFGCRTIVTSRHQSKLDRAAELGADACVLASEGGFARAVREHTGGRGVRICVDSIGQAVFEACLKSLAPGGTFVTCGCTSGPIAQTNLARMFWLQQRIIGSTMGDMAEFRRVVALFRRGALVPVVDSVFDAEHVPDAYARLESGAQFGKVVVRWS
jgi:NADPH:quinone reductase-like Zn-dependent oxidoreductase